MKQLAASIVVIFALGLALGSFVSGSGDEPELPELFPHRSDRFWII